MRTRSQQSVFRNQRPMKNDSILFQTWSFKHVDIRRGENVLIVCDPTTAEIGQSCIATQKRSDRVLLIVMPKSRHHGEEPPSPVAALMRQQQVVIAATKYSLTHKSRTSSIEGWCSNCYDARDDL